MLSDKLYSSGGTNLQTRRPDSVNVISPTARLMPSTNDALIQTLPLNDPQKAGHINYTNYYGSRANKRQAPSTVSAEAYLNSRISMRPVYIHNEMITKIQNISDLAKDPPRFKDQVDILA